MADRVLQLFVVLMCVFYAVMANMKTIPPSPGESKVKSSEVQFLTGTIKLKELFNELSAFCIEYPMQCFDGKRAYNVGKYFPIHRSCKQMFCREDYTLVIENCGIVEIPEGYKNVQDLTKRFPHCCVQLVKISDEHNAAAELTTTTTKATSAAAETTTITATTTAATTTTTTATSTAQSSLQN